MSWLFSSSSSSSYSFASSSSLEHSSDASSPSSLQKNASIPANFNFSIASLLSLSSAVKQWNFPFRWKRYVQTCTFPFPVNSRSSTVVIAERIGNSIIKWLFRFIELLLCVTPALIGAQWIKTSWMISFLQSKSSRLFLKTHFMSRANSVQFKILKLLQRKTEPRRKIKRLIKQKVPSSFNCKRCRNITHTRGREDSFFSNFLSY